MNWRCRLLVLTVAFFTLNMSACSKQKDTEKEPGGIKTSTQQATEAIQEYGRKPIDKAKRTQSLGEERTRSIDEAMENLDKR